MEPIGHHIMLRLADDRVIAPTVEARRMAARIVLGLGERFRLLGCRFADTHLHLLAACGWAASGRFVQSLTNALHRRIEPGAPFQRARRKPIDGQHHFGNAFRYVLAQEQHHGISLDPWHDASNLPDLLGMRVTGAYTLANVRALLPRITRAELLEILGAPELATAPLALEALADAAAGALALTRLVGRSPAIVQARCAAVHIAAALSTAEIARLLGVTLRTVERLRKAPAPAALMRAVELQLRLRGALAGRPAQSG